MKTYYYGLKPLHWLILFCLLSATAFYFLYPCAYEFERQTFKGHTDERTVIALSIEGDDAELKGEGVHQYSNGKRNDIYFTGSVDCETGYLTLREHYISSNIFYGTIRGRLINENTQLVGSWTNSRGDDLTDIHLMITTKSPEQVLATESIPTIGEQANADGRRVVERARGLWNGIKEAVSGR